MRRLESKRDLCAHQAPWPVGRNKGMCVSASPALSPHIKTKATSPQGKTLVQQQQHKFGLCYSASILWACSRDKQRQSEITYSFQKSCIQAAHFGCEKQTHFKMISLKTNSESNLFYSILTEINNDRAKLPGSVLFLWKTEARDGLCKRFGLNSREKAANNSAWVWFVTWKGWLQIFLAFRSNVMFAVIYLFIPPL